MPCYSSKPCMLREMAISEPIRDSLPKQMKCINISSKWNPQIQSAKLGCSVINNTNHTVCGFRYSDNQSNALLRLKFKRGIDYKEEANSYDYLRGNKI